MRTQYVARYNTDKMFFFALHNLCSVDRIVETAMAASEVREQVLLLMKEVERQERLEVKMRAMERENRQAEDDYCEEDKEALRKCREDRRNEDRNARRGGDEDGGKGEDGKGSGAESGSLDDLKDKIRLLQVQLKVQHVQALQSMNSEVVTLQAQIIKELQALPFVTSLDALFTENSASLLKPRPVVAEPTASVSSAGADDSDGTGSGGSGAESKDFKTSLLTLLAELVDSACHAIRSDLLAISSATSSATASKELLDQHLGWMRIVLADGSTYCKTQLDAVVAALVEQANGHADASSTGTDTEKAAAAGTAPAGNKDEVAMRLALLPDYRAKTLYLASLVDLAAVQDIIGPQLLQRLEEILLEGKECIRRSATATTAAASSTVGASAEDCMGESKDGEVAAAPSGPVYMEPCLSEPSEQDKPCRVTPVQVNLNDIDDDGDFAVADDGGVDVGGAAEAAEAELPPPPPVPTGISTTPLPPPPARTATNTCDSCSSNGSSGSEYPRKPSRGTQAAASPVVSENDVPNIPPPTFA